MTREQHGPYSVHTWLDNDGDWIGRVDKDAGLGAYATTFVGQDDFASENDALDWARALATSLREDSGEFAFGNAGDPANRSEAVPMFYGEQNDNS